MEATEESVTDYFSYVKNVLGVQTLQSSSLKDSLAQVSEVDEVPAQNAQPEPTTSELAAQKNFKKGLSHSEIRQCDLLFLNIKTNKDASVFSANAKELGDKMIQAMRLGSRKILVEEVSVNGEFDPPKIIQSIADQVKTKMVVLYSTNPVKQGVIQNLGPLKYIETFSPGYLLEHSQAKKVAWMDLQKVMRELGIS